MSKQLRLDLEKVDLDEVRRPMPEKLQKNVRISSLGNCMVSVCIEPYAGCGMGCAYCYAVTHDDYLHGKHFDGFSKGMLRSAEIENSKAAFLKAFERSGQSGELTNALRRKIPVHMSVDTDPFQWIEKKEKVTLEMMKILNEYEYPTVISTKNPGMLLEEPWKSEFDRMKSVVLQCSIISADDKLGKSIEVACPLPSERLKVLKTISDSGRRVVARVSPILPTLTDTPEAAESNMRAFAEANVRNVMVQNFWFHKGHPFLDVLKPVYEYMQLHRNPNMSYTTLKPKEISREFCEYKKFGREFGHVVTTDAPAAYSVFSDTIECSGTYGVKGFGIANWEILNIRTAIFYAMTREGKNCVFDEFVDYMIRKHGAEILSPRHFRKVYEFWNGTFQYVPGAKIVGRDADLSPIVTWKKEWVEEEFAEHLSSARLEY